VWCLDVVPFPYHGDVTLQVTFQASSEIFRVGKDGPFVVELVLWKPGDKTAIDQNETKRLPRGLEMSFHSIGGSARTGKRDLQVLGFQTETSEKFIRKMCLMLKTEKQWDKLSEEGGVFMTGSHHPWRYLKDM